MSNYFSKVSLIAEVAQSYEGSMDVARLSFEAAKNAGADHVNIQVVTAAELAVPGYEYYDLYKRLEIPESDWKALFAYGRKLGIGTVASVFGATTAKKLAEMDVDVFKVHAADTANIPFLEVLSKIGKPVMLATGGATLGEISLALRTLQKHGKVDVALLPGLQNSPTAPQDSHLSRVSFLKNYFKIPVGYADHVDGESPLATVFPSVCIAAGADFVEKHITLNRADKKEDYISALNPDEFARTVKLVAESRKGLGVAGGDVGEGEVAYREMMKKRVVAKRDLQIGQTLSYDDVDLLRTPVPSDLWDLESAVGRILVKPVKALEPVQSKDLSEKASSKKRVIAVLNCRNQSKRLYAKPLQLVGDDKSILELLVSQVRMVPRINDIVLGISEEPENIGYEAVAKKLNLPYVFGSDHDALGRMIKAADFMKADTIFRMTTECPFAYLDNIDEMIRRHFEEGAALTICENLPEGTYFEIIELSALKASHAQGDKRHRSEFITLFINQNPDRFKVLKVLPPENLRRPDIRLTVDYPEDLIVMRRIYEAAKGQWPIPISFIIKFLDENPEIKNINGNIEAGAGRIWN